MDKGMFMERMFPQQIEDLRALIRIPSVSRGEPQDGMPLGQAVHDALHFTLELARRLGFPTVYDLDGYCGIVEFGRGEEMLGIMAHLDVVPAGSGWTFDPFSAELADGRIYGRGTIDDKGAAISALYAMAAVMQSGVPMRRRVRLILGCDEERGWSCMERYHQTEPEPDLAFTPDADYPVVNSEMGILHTTYHKAYASAVRMQVGAAPNVIPGEAGATVRGKTLTAKGRGGHAAMPELADNALQKLAGMLRTETEGEDKALFDGLWALWQEDRHGQSLGIDREDASGRLTYSPDMLTIDDAGVTLVTDCRYPFSVSHDELIAALDKAYGALGFVRTDERNQDSHYIPADSELVRTLLDVYNKHTGRNEQPLSIGGGTYARSFKNAVAFGINPVGEDDRCHMPDEYITLEQMRFDTEVMAEAVQRLAAERG